MVARHKRRTYVMRGLRRGLLTVTEAAIIADVSRQRVQAWCDAAGVDPRKARANLIARVIQDFEREENLRAPLPLSYADG